MSSEDLNLAVDRCICADVPFAALKRMAEERGLGLEGLKRETNCCRGCGLCEPYVRLMLRTGRVAFPVLSQTEVEAAMAEGE